MTGTVTIMHLADVHLGAGPSLTAADEDAAHLRSVVERAFAQAIDDALAEPVDLVVIPGDLFDGAWADYRVALRAAQQMARLREAGIRCAISRGNHDAESQISGHTPWPDNVKVFDHRRPETWLLDDLGLAVHGQSFARRDVTDNLALAYPAAVPGKLNIGLLHTALDGREGHSNYAPCRVDDLLSRGYDYWALGHVHAHECVHRDPWIVYPGNLQGRHARELGPKGYVLARFRDGACDIEWRCCDVLRWVECRIELAPLPDLAALYAAVVEAVAAEQDMADGRELAVRLKLCGSGAVAAAAHRDPEGLRERLELALAALDAQRRVWLEAVRLERHGGRDDDAAEFHGGDAGRVLEEFLAERGAAVLPELIGELEPLLRKLPARLAEAGLSAGSRAWSQGLYRSAEALLAEALRPQPEDASQ